MKVPYAKVLAVSVKDLNPLTKDNLGIARNINFVPYILLKSIDRVNENNVTRPTYEYAGSRETTGPDYTMLPMEFTDFQLMETATLNPESIPLSSLWRIISKAESFGYSPEVYGQVLLNRLLYPLFILLIFIILAIIAWNNRLGANQYFKATWILVFPVFALVCQFFNQVITFAFKLGNYGLLSICKPFTAVFIGFGIYFVFIFIASVLFLSEKAD